MQVQRDTKETSRLESEFIKKTTESQFAKDKEEYGLKDYLKDIQSGKKQKLRIMLPDGAPYTDEILEQHAIAQKIDLSLPYPSPGDITQSLDFTTEYNDLTN